MSVLQVSESPVLGYKIYKPTTTLNLHFQPSACLLWAWGSSGALSIEHELRLQEQSGHQRACHTCRDLLSWTRPRFVAPYAAKRGVASPSAPAPSMLKI